MSISAMIRDVKGNERTLTVYDATNREAVEEIKAHFEVQNVTVEEASLPEGPDDFAVLYDDNEYIASADLDRLWKAVTFEDGLLETNDFYDSAVPDVLRHIDDTTFSSQGKRRMILASREIEEQAWNRGEGELHAGFQRLSLLKDQWNLYERIADRGVDVHVYGVPDWRPPETEWLTVHDDDEAEIRESWFVVYDAPEVGDCALVAEETDPNVFDGFWTYDDDLTADVLGHLRSEYGTASAV